MTQLRRILEALAEAPGTAPEIAAELDLPANVVRAGLHLLRDLGVIERAGYVPPFDRKRGVRGCVLYRITEAARSSFCALDSNRSKLAQTSAGTGCA